MDTTKTPSQKQQSPVVTTAAIVNLFASGDPQAPYKMRDIYEAELQALRERLSRMEEATKACRLALVDLLHHGVEYPERGEIHQADPKMAQEAISIADAALSNKP